MYHINCELPIPLKWVFQNISNMFPCSLILVKFHSTWIRVADLESSPITRVQEKISVPLTPVSFFIQLRYLSETGCRKNKKCCTRAHKNISRASCGTSQPWPSPRRSQRKSDMHICIDIYPNKIYINKCINKETYSCKNICMYIYIQMHMYAYIYIWITMHEQYRYIL